jgi:hypothetical protein
MTGNDPDPGFRAVIDAWADDDLEVELVREHGPTTLDI